MFNAAITKIVGDTVYFEYANNESNIIVGDVTLGELLDAQYDDILVGLEIIVVPENSMHIVVPLAR